MQTIKKSQFSILYPKSIKWLFGIMLLTTNIQGEFIRDNTKEIVKDTVSGLMWQDNLASQTSDTWANAITLCEGLTLGGYNDWRLPNINELTSIVDIAKNPAPLIYGAFQKTEKAFYISSTTPNGTSNMWRVNFSYGTTTSDTSKGYGGSVRCVRGPDE